MIDIREVRTKKEQKDFVKFPLSLYRDSEYFVPMLYGGEFNIFKKDFPFNKVCDSVCFTAYEDGKPVGRIQGIIQREANKKWGQKRVRFTRFDSINDERVSKALFDKVEEWAKAKGMDEFVGPLGYSDLEREGLLIEGFDQPQTYEEQYNYDYYQKLIEAYGFEKDVDWLEYQLFSPSGDEADKIIALGEKLLDRYGLHLYQAKTIKEIIDRHINKIFDVIEKAYSRLYGTMPLNDEIIDNYISDFKMIMRPQDMLMIYDGNENLVAFAFMFPSISEAARISDGRITLPFLVKFLKGKKDPKVLDLGLIGILPEYEPKGIAAVMIGILLKLLKNSDLDHLETNLILEHNDHMQNLMKRFNKVQNKRRRCFRKEIKTTLKGE